MNWSEINHGQISATIQLDMTRKRQFLLRKSTNLSRKLLTNEAVLGSSAPRLGADQVLFVGALGRGFWSGRGSALLFRCFRYSSTIQNKDQL